MNIAVYLGANEGNNYIYKEKVQELGKWIGVNGHKLIYGGSKAGLMGALAESVLHAGGEVIGVEPQFFIEKELQLDGLTELIVTPDMQTRKAKMIEIADFYLAFPGGTGTMEEISEVISMGCLGMTHKKYGYYNIQHYYDAVKAQYDYMVQEGFMTAENRDKIIFVSSLGELAEHLKDEIP